VSSSVQFYMTTILVYLGVDIIACLGLNLQFGMTGLVNFSFIVFQAAGAYTAAVVTLGPSSGNGGFQRYVGGANWPFPLPILAAAVVGGLLALIIGLFGLRRLRADYQAMVLLVVSLIATTVANNASGLVNGANGLALVPKPLQSTFNLSPLGFQWVFALISLSVAALIYLLVRRITNSPLGRTLRAVRENEFAAIALGKNVAALRLRAFVIGGAIAAVSGALFVEFITAWSPASWLFTESFVYFAALIVGGAGNNLGAVVGAALVPVGFLEATRFIPQFGRPGLVDALQWIVVGLLVALFLWFWPQGVFPERKRRYPPSRLRPSEADSPAPDRAPEMSPGA